MRSYLPSAWKVAVLLAGVLLIYNSPMLLSTILEGVQLSWKKVGPTLPFMVLLLVCWGYVQAWRVRNRAKIRRSPGITQAVRQRAESLHSGFVGGMVAYGTLGTMHGVAQELDSGLQGMIEALNSTMVALALAQIFYTYYLARKFIEIRKIVHDDAGQEDSQADRRLDFDEALRQHSSRESSDAGDTRNDSGRSPPTNGRSDLDPTTQSPEGADRKASN